MSGTPEASYVLKLRRAQEHLKSLDTTFQTFVRRHPCPVEEKFDAQSKQRRWRVSDNPPDPNVLWSPIFGEFFFNCRSALDQLIWALVDKSKRGSPDRNLQYPIFDDPLDFACKMRKPLKDLPAHVLTLVEHTQPYNGRVPPELYSLTLLNQLGNVDKHRRPNLTVYATNGYTAFGEFPHDSVRPHIGPVKKGTVLLELPVRIQEDMDVNFVPSFGVAFAEGHAGYVPADQVLGLIVNRVRRIVDELQPFA